MSSITLHPCRETRCRVQGRKTYFALLLSILILLATPASSFGQTQPIIVIPSDLTGPQPYASFEGGIRENVNLGTGVLNVYLPILSLPQRHGGTFDLGWESVPEYSLQPRVTTNYSGTTVQFAWGQSALTDGVGAGGAWRLSLPTLHSAQQYYPNDVSPDVPYLCQTGWVLTLADGTKHSFGALEFGQAGCPDPEGPWIAQSTDSSYILLNINNPSDMIATLKDGTQIHFSYAYSTPVPMLLYSSYPTKIIDPNGNTITFSSNFDSGNGTITDSVGRVITFSGGLSWKDANGTQRTLTGSQSTSSGSTFYFNHPVNSGGTQDCVATGQNTQVSAPGAPYSLGNAEVTNTLQVPGTGLSYVVQTDPAGEITKITYPAGGYTRYDYATFPGTLTLSNAVCNNVDRRQVTAKHVCTLSNGQCTSSTENTTTYTPTFDASINFNQSTSVLSPDPSGTPNLTNYTFDTTHNVETERDLYKGSSTPLRTIETAYNIATSTDVLPVTVTTIVKDVTPNLTSVVQTNYDTIAGGSILINNPISVLEYDYNGNLVRTTDTTWLKSTNYDMNHAHILDRPIQTTVLNSSGTQVAQTTYNYDNYGPQGGSPAASGGTQLQSMTNIRGNLTSIARWLNTTGGTLTTSYQYDDAGNVLAVIDPKNNQTNYNYADNFQQASCSPASNGLSGNAAAYPYTITNALGQVSTYSYLSCFGLLATTQDANHQTTDYSYEAIGRTTEISYPDHGSTTWLYNDIPPISITKTSAISSNPVMNRTDVEIDDGLGRVSETQLTSDPEGTTYVDTLYDVAERKASVSNPYRSTSDTTYGITQYAYDPLNRTTLVTEQDGSTVTTSYSAISSPALAFCTTVTDEASHARMSCSDGLGRMTEIWEDPGSSPHLNYETDYAYDGLDNLVTVTQKGSNSANARNRTFTYDSLSRLLCSANPEIHAVTCPASATGSFPFGAVIYAYDNDGNLVNKTAPSPNQASNGTKAVVTTYTYDSLNRLTGKSYQDAYAQTLPTPAVSYGYDGNTPSGCMPPTIVSPYGSGIPITPTNTVGRRSGMCDGSGATAWVYDAMGRPTVEERTINGVTKNIGYPYYLDGLPRGIFYVSTNLINFEVTAAGRIFGATDELYNYVPGETAFAPNGAVVQMYRGNYVGESRGYNRRLQKAYEYSGYINSSGSQVFINKLCFDYHLYGGLNIQVGSKITCTFTTTAPGDNGNLYEVQNQLDDTRTQNFNYDSLNRINQAYTNGLNWGQQFTTDAWGNLTAVGTISGKTSVGVFTALANATNQLNCTAGCSSAYDAAGNMTTDGNGALTYDDENRILTANGLTYTYDGDGKRVMKSSGTLYWTGVGSDPLSESDLNGNVNEEYVFFNGERVARIDRPSLKVHYFLDDQLGSSRIVFTPVSQYQYTVEQDLDYTPYGIVASGSPVDPFQFTGKERDTESGLDNFGARYNASTMGRFMTPDPLGGKLIDPQTLNKYAYTRNNPTTLIDPTGMYTCADQADCQSKQDIAFEKARQQDLKSKDSDVVRAANAYGDPTKDNGVGVKFGDPGKGRDAITTNGVGQDPNSPNGLRAEETVTVRSGLSGSALDAAVGHEGSHVADAQDFVSAITTAGGMDQSKNLSTYATELKAYMVTQSVLSSENEKRGVGDCGVDPCILGAGVMPAQAKDTINRLLANPANHYGAAPNYGVTPANPGPVLYPSLTTPK